MRPTLKPLPPSQFPLAWGGVALALLLNLVFFVFAVRGSRLEADNLLAELAMQQRRLVTAPPAPRPVEPYRDAAALVQRFVDQLPDRSGLARQAGELDALLRRHGLPSGAIVLSPEKSEWPNLAKYSATLDASGSYATVRAFLAELQNSPQLFCIQHLSLKRQSERGKGVSLQLGLALYMRPARPESAGPPGRNGYWQRCCCCWVQR